MLSEKVAELEHRLALVERAFEQERMHQQLLIRKYRCRDTITKLMYLVGLVAFVFLTQSSSRVQSVTSVIASQRPVTVLEAPVLIVDPEKKAIVEISADKGKYGISVNGLQGQSLFFGSSKSTNSGLIHVMGANQKLLSIINGEGFTSYNSTGKAVASMGARAGGSGFLTLGNANGDGIVEAGMTQEGRGIVRAYPLGGVPPMVIPNTIQGGKGK